MSNLLNIGRSGLRAFSRSMDAVSHNIANAENPDYVRRSVQMSDATVSSALNPAYLSQTGLNGVRVAQTVRASDEFIEAQVRQSGAARMLLFSPYGRGPLGTGANDGSPVTETLWPGVTVSSALMPASRSSMKI